MKTILIVGSAVGGLILVAAALFWWMSGRPLYQPGMVREGEDLRASLRPPEQPDDEHRWRVEDGVELHHFRAGEGRNVLVIHGGPGSPHRNPWPGLSTLTEEYAFHYYDQRGCGDSTRPIDAFSSRNTFQNMKTLERTLGISAQLADIERIRRILGQEKLMMVGHSFGGFLASLYAAEFPERVEGMVLVAPADVLVMPQESGGLFEDVRRRLPEDRREAYDGFMEDYLGFGSLFSKSEEDLVGMQREFGRYYQEALGRDLPEQAKPGGWMAWAMYLSMGKRHDYRGALADVEAPVLVIHGAEDIQSDEASRAYAEAFPNAEVQVVEGAGHFVFYDQPDRFADVVHDFLEGTN